MGINTKMEDFIHRRGAPIGPMDPGTIAFYVMLGLFGILSVLGFAWIFLDSPPGPVTIMNDAVARVTVHGCEKPELNISLTDKDVHELNVYIVSDDLNRRILLTLTPTAQTQSYNLPASLKTVPQWIKYVSFTDNSAASTAYVQIVPDSDCGMDYGQVEAPADIGK